MADAIELATAYMQVVPSMAGSQGKLAQEILPEATKAADTASKGFSERFAAGMSKLGTAKVVAAGLGAGIIGGFAGLYKIGKTFDEVSDTIRVGTGASGRALDGLVGVAKDVGRSVPAKFGAIAPVVADLNTRLGLSGDTLKTVSSQYLEAGRILGETVDIGKTSAAFTSFGISGSGVEKAMDSLFQVSQATGVGMNDLASKVQANAPALKTLGFSFTDSAALIGSFDKAGLNAQAMAASLGKGIVTLARQGEAPSDAFKRVAGEIGGFIAKGDEAGALNLASKVFGTRGATQFVDALKQGKLKTDDLMGSIGATSDTILRVGGETADFAEKWQMVKNNAALALEPLGSAVFSALGDALTTAMPYLEDFGTWLSENQWALGAVATIIGVTLVAAFFAWAGSIWASTIALLANPMTWIVLGIMALIAGLILLVANWDAVVAWLHSVWSGIVGWLGDVWASIASAISGFASGVWGKITGTFTGIYNTITDWLGKAVSFVTGIPDRVISAIAGLGQLGAKAAGWFGGVMTSAVQKFGEVADWVKGVPGKIMGALGDIGKLLLNSGKSLVDGFLKGIQGAWDGLVGWVKGGMENLRGLWPFSPAKWGPFSGHGYVTYSGEALGQDFAASIEAQEPVVGRAAYGLMEAANPGARATTGPAAFSATDDRSLSTAIIQAIREGLYGAQILLDGRLIEAKIAFAQAEVVRGARR